jgi:soluble lytic murein transglycosylase-like protein
VGLLLLGGRNASAQSPTDQYLALRRNFPVTRGLTLQALADDPQGHAGEILELDGRLAGISRDVSGDGAVVILTTREHGTVTLRMSRVPTWLQAGAATRVLCIAVKPAEGELRIGLPDMEVVAIASASDIAATEARQARQEAVKGASRPAPNAPRTARAPLSSRSTITRTVSLAGGKTLSPAAQSVFAPYKNYIRNHNRRLTDAQAEDITYAILTYSEQLDMDPRLIVAVVIAESDFRIAETSKAGAMGLIQLMPDEVKRLRLTNPYDPVQNIAGGVFLLKERLCKYSGSMRSQDATLQQILLACASYNAGMGAVKKYGGIPPYRETRGYVQRIERLYRELCAGDAAASSGGSS